MPAPQPITGPAARTASWIAAALGALSLAAALFTPVIGALHAAIFFAVAWGVRRGQPWAAFAGSCFLVIPLILAGFRWTGGAVRSAGELTGVLLSAGLALVCAGFLLRAARELAHHPGAHAGQAWPWVAVIAVTASGWLCLRPFMIPTGAMEDTLLVGDHIFIETASARLGRLPHRGDLVVLRYPIDHTQFFVKRVVGVPGDRLRIQNKQLYLNGAPVPEPYARHKTEYLDTYRDNFPSPPNISLFAPAKEMLHANVHDRELVVPEGKYFVLGDNRDNSLDSRYWGFVSRSEILGRPVLVYASFNLGQDLTQTGKPPSVLNTRWSRLFKRL